MKSPSLHLILILCLGAPAAKPQAATSNTPSIGPGPKIVFAERTHDFGRIRAEESVRHDFTFTNIGNAMLEIHDVRPSCGCTVVGAWSRQVEPGKAGIIPILFKSASFAGPVRKSIRLECNDQTQTNLSLEIKALIWAPIDVIPTYAMINVPAEDPSNATATVRIVSNLEGPVTLYPPECTNRTFATELKQVQAGKEYQLTIRAVPPIDPATPYGLISIKTSSPQAPLLQVTVYARLQEMLTVTPPRIVVPSEPATNKLFYTLIIRDFSTNGCFLSEPSINADNVAINLKEYQPGKYFNVRLTFPAGFKLSHKEPVEFRIRSSHPQIPLIRVPVVDGHELANAAKTTPAPPR
jgi:hypothetical protein